MTHASRLTPSPFLVIAFFAATAAVAQPVPIDLGALGGTSSTPAAINDSGQVVGGSKVASGDAHAFVWTPASGMMDLGTLFLPGNCSPTPTCRSSVAQAINNLGHVAVTGPPDVSVFVLAFLEGAYVWTPDGGMVSLDQSHGGSAATAVNDVGQVVGTHDLVGHLQAFMWTARRGTQMLGRLGNNFPNWAVDVNNSGLVVGSSTMAPVDLHAAHHAFAWNDNRMVDLGT